MADSKFSKLPYIAADQPDCYETEDLPESEQGLGDEEDTQDDGVEKIPVDTQAAFLKFNKPHSSCVGDFTSAEDGLETTGDALKRIENDLQKLQTFSKTNFCDNPGTLLIDIEKLQAQIAAVRDSRGSCLVTERDQDYQQLLAQLQSITTSNKSPVKSKSSPEDSQPNTVRYELNVEAGSGSISKISTLEQRVSRLESLLGADSSETALTEDSGSNLMDMTSTMLTKLNLLDQDNVDKLTARFQLLLQSCDKLSESKVNELKQSESVEQTYNIIKQWETTEHSLPQIVDRLYALQDLHQQAMDFSASLRTLEQAQTELQAKLSSHTKLVTDVGTQFQANTEVIKENISSLDQRIAKLNK